MKALLFVILLMPFITQAKPICYIVSSYANGYAWEDEIQQALKVGLEDRCVLIHYELDSKNRFGRVKKKARQALLMMNSVKPDVIITTDNNAYTYFVQEYRTSVKVPVFSLGLNWAPPVIGKDTLVVEVPPIEQLLLNFPRTKTLKLILGDTETSAINIEYYKQVVERYGIEFHYCTQNNFDEWLSAFIISQKYDLVILQNNAGIDGWKSYEAKKFVRKHTRTNTASVNSWMLPYVGTVFNKLPSEQATLLIERVLQYLDTGKVENSISYNIEFEVFTNKRILKKINKRRKFRLNEVFKRSKN